MPPTLPPEWGERIYRPRPDSKPRKAELTKVNTALKPPSAMGDTLQPPSPLGSISTNSLQPPSPRTKSLQPSPRSKTLQPPSPRAKSLRAPSPKNRSRGPPSPRARSTKSYSPSASPSPPSPMPSRLPRPVLEPVMSANVTTRRPREAKEVKESGSDSGKSSGREKGIKAGLDHYLKSLEANSEAEEEIDSDKGTKETQRTSPISASHDPLAPVGLELAPTQKAGSSAALGRASGIAAQSRVQAQTAVLDGDARWRRGHGGTGGGPARRDVLGAQGDGAQMQPPQTTQTHEAHGSAQARTQTQTQTRPARAQGGSVNESTTLQGAERQPLQHHWAQTRAQTWVQTQQTWVQQQAVQQQQQPQPSQSQSSQPPYMGNPHSKSPQMTQLNQTTKSTTHAKLSLPAHTLTPSTVPNSPARHRTTHSLGSYPAAHSSEDLHSSMLRPMPSGLSSTSTPTSGSNTATNTTSTNTPTSTRPKLPRTPGHSHSHSYAYGQPQSFPYGGTPHSGHGDNNTTVGTPEEIRRRSLDSMSASATAAARDALREPVLPGHPTLWTPSELAQYLKYALRTGGTDGRGPTLPAPVIEDVVSWVLRSRMTGSHFLQGLEGSRGSRPPPFLPVLSAMSRRLRRVARGSLSGQSDTSSESALSSGMSEGAGSGSDSDEAEVTRVRRLAHAFEAIGTGSTGDEAGTLSVLRAQVTGDSVEGFGRATPKHESSHWAKHMPGPDEISDPASPCAMPRWRRDSSSSASVPVAQRKSVPGTASASGSPTESLHRGTDVFGSTIAIASPPERVRGAPASRVSPKPEVILINKETPHLTKCTSPELPDSPEPKSKTGGSPPPPYHSDHLSPPAVIFPGTSAPRTPEQKSRSATATPPRAREESSEAWSKSPNGTSPGGRSQGSPGKPVSSPPSRASVYAALGHGSPEKPHSPHSRASAYAALGKGSPEKPPRSPTRQRGTAMTHRSPNRTPDLTSWQIYPARGFRPLGLDSDGSDLDSDWDDDDENGVISLTLGDPRQRRRNRVVTARPRDATARASDVQAAMASTTDATRLTIPSPVAAPALTPVTAPRPLPPTPVSKPPALAPAVSSPAAPDSTNSTTRNGQKGPDRSRREVELEREMDALNYRIRELETRLVAVESPAASAAPSRSGSVSPASVSLSLSPKGVVPGTRVGSAVALGKNDTRSTPASPSKAPTTGSARLSPAKDSTVSPRAHRSTPASPSKTRSPNGLLQTPSVKGTSHRGEVTTPVAAPAEVKTDARSRARDISGGSSDSADSGFSTISSVLSAAGSYPSANSSPRRSPAKTPGRATRAADSSESQLDRYRPTPRIPRDPHAVVPSTRSWLASFGLAPDGSVQGTGAPGALFLMGLGVGVSFSAVVARMMMGRQ